MMEKNTLEVYKDLKKKEKESMHQYTTCI